MDEEERSLYVLGSCAVVLMGFKGQNTCGFLLLLLNAAEWRFYCIGLVICLQYAAQVEGHLLRETNKVTLWWSPGDMCPSI